VLWSYGMMLRDAARRTGTDTPARAPNTPAGSSVIREFAREQTTSRHPGVGSVFLDDVHGGPTESFIRLGIGRPCLHTMTTQVCELRNPSQVMKLGSLILQQNCPGESRDGLPQMIKSLCDLMDELGALK
jgi:hypothetical protein